jgi:hypothetical protein
LIKIREIDHIVLRVVDLDRMIRFYTEVLGCTIERRQDEIGLVQLRAGSSLVDLVPVDQKAAMSTISASAWSPSMKRPSAPTWRSMTWRMGRANRATVRKARGRRSMSTTPKGTRWS